MRDESKWVLVALNGALGSVGGLYIHSRRHEVYVR